MKEAVPSDLPALLFGGRWPAKYNLDPGYARWRYRAMIGDNAIWRTKLPYGLVSEAWFQSGWFSIHDTEVWDDPAALITLTALTDTCCHSGEQGSHIWQFHVEDLICVKALMRLVLVSYWSFTLVDSAGRVAIMADHDSNLMLETNNEMIANHYIGELKDAPMDGSWLGPG